MRRVSEDEGLVGEGLGIRENEGKIKSDPYLFLTIYIERTGASFMTFARH